MTTKYRRARAVAAARRAKRRKRIKHWSYAVAVNFTGDIYPGSDFERRLTAIAKRRGAADLGGGTDFDSRDVIYGCERYSQALELARHMRRFRRVTKAQIQCGCCCAAIPE